MNRNQITAAEFRAHLRRPCQTAEELAIWLQTFAGVAVPRTPVCAGHNAPFEYLRRAYFEPGADLVVWAPRGGGKTRLGAVATLLDLLHKPGVAVRILGGSLEQSLKMWEHLFPSVTHLASDQLALRAGGGRRLSLANGSSAAVLTQSERAVRGLRVQKLRCDEVELFKPEIWEAAQLVTKSKPLARKGAALVAGAVEAISTLHTPYGLMNHIVESATQNKTRIVRWCLLEVLERCPAERACHDCSLWDECRGVAKTKCTGFVRIDDAIAMKRRVSAETWEAEMLCRRPSRKNSVFPNFDPDVHVRDTVPGPLKEVSLAIDFGFAAPFVCLWLATHESGAMHVLDEYVQPGRTVDEHVAEIERRQWGKLRRIACDPAGSGRNEQTAISNVALLRSKGYNVRCRRSLIQDGLELVRAALRPAAGQPTLFIHPRCKTLIKALRSYHYAPAADGRSTSELPLKDGDHDHLIDALRYHLVNRGSDGDTSRRY